jgi:hypothetical protein|tara:strand:- start:1478 stop:1693 length:216 start_codon:yes stop_codon:yes gene_type:complete
VSATVSAKGNSRTALLAGAIGLPDAGAGSPNFIDNLEYRRPTVPPGRQFPRPAADIVTIGEKKRRPRSMAA